MRFTKNAGPKATAKPPSKGPQKSGSLRSASIAPGTAITTALSISSMTVINTVSAARAIGTTATSASPERSNGSEVSV